MNNEGPLSGKIVAIKANYLIVEIDIFSAKTIRDDFASINNQRSLLCTLRRRLSHGGSSAHVGDFVYLDAIDWKEGRAVICGVKPRTSFLSRPAVANVSDVIVVFSLADPPFDQDQATRFLLTAENTGLSITFVFTKNDLITLNQSKKRIEQIQRWGYDPFSVSLKTGHGVNRLKRHLERKQLSVICGPSGVGKTSLINMLIPEISLKVGSLSKKIRRGCNTTRHVQLFKIADNCCLADTPGFNRPELLIPPNKLSKLFPELRIRLRNNQCKFRNCMHLDEPGCCIDKDWERYPFYRNLMKELLI